MGYTHYWYRPEHLDRDKFKAFANDCKEIAAYCQDQLGIKLADGMGQGQPNITENGVIFNGSDEQPIGQWTTEEEIIIPWPDESADLVPVNPDPITDKRAGHWFADDTLSQRTAPIDQKTGLGSGSYETFDIMQKQKRHEFDKKEPLVFSCTKTAFRPYDVAVTACLVSLKHHFPRCKVSSDGDMKNWLDGQMICERLFGYGLDFLLS